MHIPQPQLGQTFCLTEFDTWSARHGCSTSHAHFLGTAWSNNLFDIFTHMGVKHLESWHLLSLSVSPLVCFSVLLGLDRWPAPMHMSCGVAFPLLLSSQLAWRCHAGLLPISNLQVLKFCRENIKRCESPWRFPSGWSEPPSAWYVHASWLRWCPRTWLCGSCVAVWQFVVFLGSAYKMIRRHTVESADVYDRFLGHWFACQCWRLSGGSR